MLKGHRQIKWTAWTQLFSFFPSFFWSLLSFCLSLSRCLSLSIIHLFCFLCVFVVLLKNTTVMKSHNSYPNFLGHMHNTLPLDKSQSLWNCLRENEPQFHNRSSFKWEQTHFRINTPPLIRPVTRENGQRRGTIIQIVLRLSLTEPDQLSFHSAATVHTSRIIIPSHVFRNGHLWRYLDRQVSER